MPVVVRIVLVMLLVPGGFALLWWLLPHTPVAVGVMVVYVLLAGGGALWRVLGSRELNRPPSRNPKPPPSTTPPSTS